MVSTLERFLLDQTSDGLLLIQKNNRVTFANQTFCQLVGIQPNQVLGELDLSFLNVPRNELVGDQQLQSTIFLQCLAKASEQTLSNGNKGLNQKSLTYFLVYNPFEQISTPCSVRFNAYDKESVVCVFRIETLGLSSSSFGMAFSLETPKNSSLQGSLSEVSASTSSLSEIFGDQRLLSIVQELHSFPCYGFEFDLKEKKAVNMCISKSAMLLLDSQHQQSSLPEITFIGQFNKYDFGITDKFVEWAHRLLNDQIPQSNSLVYEASLPNKKVISVRVSYLGESAWDVPKFIAFIEDVTPTIPLDMIKSQLEDTHNNLITFLDKLPFLIGIVELVDNDSDLIYKYLNYTIDFVVEKPRNYYIEKRLSEIAPAETIEEWTTLFKQARSENKTISMELPATKSRTGKWSWALCTHVKDNTYGFVLQDISERRNLQDQLQAAKDELEATVEERTKQLQDALTSKSRFLAIMSHEIRTPLSGILGTMSLLLESKLTDDQMEMVQIARVCGEQLIVVLNDILDSTKIDEGKIILESIPFPLISAIEESLEVVSFEAAKKKLELISDINLNFTHVIGDPNRLRQIFVNLLSNAIKFTANGEIVLTATSLREDSSGKCQIQFSVKDSGIGIPIDARSRIFEPFTQADKTVSRRYGGSGLGLSICKKLSHLMGGTMWVESEEGQGSCFYFTITVPYTTVPTPTISIPVDISAQPVLLILPNEYSSRILESKIRKWGFQVTAVKDLSAASIAIKDSPIKFRLTIVDIEFEIASIEPLCKDISSIVVIGYSSPTGLSVPNLTFMKKPIRNSPLLSHLLHSYGLDVSHHLETEHLQRRRIPEKFESIKKLKILIAEDNLFNQKVIRRLLENIGLKDLTIVDNGKQAIEATRTRYYHLIMMDVMMPDVDGFEATEIIRKEEVTGEKPVAIFGLTADAFLDTKKKCLESGMNEVLCKPLQTRELLHLLSKYFTH